MSTPAKKTRLNIRVDPDLLKWAREFAKRNEVTVTDVIEQGLERLKRDETGGGSVEVPQF